MSSPSAPAVPLVLASRSPQRVKLLDDAGLVFAFDPADIDEDAYPRDLVPHQVAEWLARAKAARVAERHPEAIVLGADTVVVLRSEILGKPEDADHARRMLSALSGSTHGVITGVALMSETRGVREVEHVVSTVTMRSLSAKEIDDYVASEQWRGKAGGYGIQDDDPFVTCMTGPVSNVIGLPIERVLEMLDGLLVDVARRPANNRP